MEERFRWGGRPCPRKEATAVRRFPGDWAALTYLGLFVAGQAAFLALGASGRAAFLRVASTSVENLTHDPLGCLVLSAFVTGGDVAGTLTWLPLIAIGLAGAIRAVGTWRTVAVAAAAHVAGTFVSEGLVGWRVFSGVLPDSFRHMTDVGPSYVVVSALALALLCLPWSKRDRRAWTWRILATGGMLALIFPGQIFAGLTHLDVAALGHVTAIAVAALAASTGWLLRRSPSAPWWKRQRSPKTTVDAAATTLGGGGGGSGGGGSGEAGQAAMPPTERPMR